MHIDTAAYIVNLADSRGMPKTIAEAAFFAQEHLRSEAAKGAWTRDLYGNYKWVSKKTGVQRRWHFQKQVLQKQEQWQGDWRNLASYPLIDWAHALVITAAKDVLAAQPENRVAKEVLERAEAARGKRGEARDDRKAKKEREEFEQRAKVWAMKRVAWENWEELFGMFVFDKDPSKERAAQLNEYRQVYMDEFLEGGKVESDGMTPAGGSPTFASSDRPPLPPFRFQDFDYVWAEASNGHTFSVRVSAADLAGTVYVLIGKGLMEFSPTSTGSRHTRNLLGGSRHTRNLLGEGYLSGTVSRLLTKPDGYAILVGELIEASPHSVGAEAPEVRQALLALWEKILRGWGAPAYKVHSSGALVPLTDDAEDIALVHAARDNRW